MEDEVSLVIMPCCWNFLYVENRAPLDDGRDPLTRLWQGRRGGEVVAECGGRVRAVRVHRVTGGGREGEFRVRSVAGRLSSDVLVRRQYPPDMEGSFGVVFVTWRCSEATVTSSEPWVGSRQGRWRASYGRLVSGRDSRGRWRRRRGAAGVEGGEGERARRRRRRKGGLTLDGSWANRSIELIDLEI